MGEISRDLEEFRKVTQTHYRKLLEDLFDKYCWKCPMRTTSMETFCRESEMWFRLSNAFELGIQDELLSRNIPVNCIDIIAAKTLKKEIKKGFQTPEFEKLILLKLKQDMTPFVDKGNVLLVKKNPKSVRKDDLILVPRSCPLSTLWFSKISQTMMPLKIFRVIKSFHKGLKYVKIEENVELPIEFVFGVVLKVIKKEDSLYYDLGLNRI